MKGKHPLIGTKVKLDGYLFSYSKRLRNKAYDCLDVNVKERLNINPETLEEGECEVIELLLKHKGMKKAQWTKPITVKS